MFIKLLRKCNNRIISKKMPYILTIIVGLLITINLLNFVGTSLGGNYDWLVLPSKYFGMPKEISDFYNNKPLYNYNNGLGWDGQFYYYISNDLLGTKGFSDNVDAPSYRWQRIGVPFLAKIISLILFQKHVSVLVFTGTQLFILLIGFFAVTKWLIENKHNPLWAVPWVLSCSVLITIRCGLPDASADALFIISFIMLLKKRYNLYSVFMTLTCLSREGYVLIAFFIFLIFILNKLENYKIYSKGRLYIKRFLVISAPGIIFVAWYLYVTVHFGVLPFKQASGIQQFYMTGWFQYLIKDISENNYGQVAGMIFYAIFVLFSLFAAIKMGKKNILYWCLIPYILLISSFGGTVMADWTGYLKGISILFLLLPIMVIQFDTETIEGYRYTTNGKQTFAINLQNKRVKILIIFLFVFFLCSGMLIDKWARTILVDNYINYTESTTDEVGDIKDYNCDFNIDSYEFEKFSKLPTQFVKDYAIATVSFKNKGNQIWSNQSDINGKGGVKVSYQIFQNNQRIMEGQRFELLSSLNPGESMKREIYIQYPDKPGKYTVRIGLIQEGVNWFYNAGSGYKDVEIEVK